MDFGSDSDGDDAFRWDLFKQTALIQRRVNELFGFEPKDKQVEAIRKLLYDKSDLILIALVSFLIVRRGAVRSVHCVVHITEVFTGM